MAAAAQVQQSDGHQIAYHQGSCKVHRTASINVIQHYEIYHPLFEYLYPHDQVRLNDYAGDYDQLVEEKGFLEAYVQVVQALTR